MKYGITLLTVLGIVTGHAQNLVLNSSFENTGQKDCSYWYDDCGNEISPLCVGTVNFGCNSAAQGADFFQNAPTGGELWCMRLKAGGSLSPGIIRTVLIGQFLGVYELKVWMRIQSYGARGDVSVFYKAGENVTGFKGTATYSETWNELTITDTIKTLSDTILIGLAATETLPQQGNIAYADLVSFTMKQNWLNTNEIDKPRVKKYSGESTVLELTQSGNYKYSFSLFNTNGQTLMLNEPMPGGSIALPKAMVPTGLYFYNVQRNGVTYTRGKILLQ